MRNILQQEDSEEADLYKLKPVVGQFLGRPVDLDSHQDAASLEKSVDRYEDDTEDDDDDSVNSLLKTVLITLRDNPEIIMAILQGQLCFFLIHGRINSSGSVYILVMREANVHNKHYM